MFGLGVFSWIAGALQLIVPSYGLRLVRRFGTHRVGWFLVMAFGSLALLHVIVPGKIAGLGSGVATDIICAIGAVLLVIGMGHIETIFSEREQAGTKERNLRDLWQSQYNEEINSLTQTKQRLLQEVVRRDQIESELSESESQYRALFADNPQAMWIFDLRSCRLLAVNNAALAQYGYGLQELLSRSASDLLPESDVASFLQDVARPCSVAQSRGLWRHRRKDSTILDVEMTAIDMRYCGCPARLILATDISNRRKHESTIRQAQKLEAMGLIASGVAEQFNDILTSIEGHASLLQQGNRDEATMDQLNRICAATARGASVARQLLAAGGRQPLNLESLDLNNVLRKQSQLLRRLVGRDVAVQIACGGYVPAVLADRRLVEHILVHLVLNARDAMPSGGAITISTAYMHVTEEHADSDQLARPGEFVRLAVLDTGSGMEPEIQARLFEPFFTTHGAAKATGLGLASVHGIVNQLAGWIEFSTEPGAGSEFRIFLPCAPASAAGPTTTVEQTQTTQPAAATATATVLLVLPDDRARGLARCTLNWHGYRVIESDCSATALLFWESQSANVDLLLTDVALPDSVSGPDLAKQLLASKPGLKVLYTGQIADDAGVPIADPLLKNFLPKPFNSEKLLKAVHDSLA